jgi:hypothetical protein
MAGSTQEQQVANLANSIVLMVTALNGTNGILSQISQISSQWTALSAANKLNAFPTAAPTGSGGLGTPDESPVTTNPINIGVAPGTELSRAISANNFAGLLTYLQGVSSVLSGSSVSANGAAAQLIALCL